MPNIAVNTPWEVYRLGKVDIHVKREDLCCPDPGPSFSKIRGLALYLEKEAAKRTEPFVGVLDTRHSKAGWGASWLCQQMGIPCIDFYPDLKEFNGQPGPNQKRAQALGAHPYPLGGKVLRSSYLYHRATKLMREWYGADAIMLPNALKLTESIDATCEEVGKYTPKELLAGTWIVSISSGTIGAGVLAGLANNRLGMVFHMGYTRSVDEARNYVVKSANQRHYEVTAGFVDENYQYSDKVPVDSIPFPCNEYYDAKAWLWLEKHVTELEQPVVFWNIGA